MVLDPCLDICHQGFLLLCIHLKAGEQLVEEVREEVPEEVEEEGGEGEALLAETESLLGRQSRSHRFGSLALLQEF